MRRNLLLIGLVLLVARPAWAENWPQWRGPRGDGTSQETGLPTAFSKTERVAWRVALPGPGGSTPVVWDDRIFITAVDGEQLVLLCIGTDGKQQWRQVVSEGNKTVRGDEGNSASNSPSTDGQYVWAMFTDGSLACYTVAGEPVWNVDLQDRFGKFKIQFGLTSTPLLDGDRLYLQLIHGDGNAKTREATITALDKKTGETIWQVGRPSEAHSENEHSYASPTLYRDGEREFLLTHGADYVVAHRLSDGMELWRCGGLHPPTRYDPTLRFVSSPLAVPGLIVVPSAKKGVTVALKPTGSGDVTENTATRYWTHSVTPDVPSPLVVDDIVYLCRENGNLIALDRETGEQFYEERTHRDRHRASPVYADGKIYLSARDGTVSVVKPGRQFELLASNNMEESISASPAISNGRIYIRTFEALYAVE
ncbi:MAG: PQQ-binding-like beta-propeller repeat protein [Planctomycetales bacterium]|nr:PQQ-binding-like beta-propeller repeat protein [Planctomycetales bacterium]